MELATIKTDNLPETSMSTLAIIQNEREALINAYDDVIEMEITDESIKIFKELRLKIRDNRTKGIEPWHTTNKAVSLAIGRTIDAIKNREVEVNKRMEKSLFKAENHFENIEKLRVDNLNAERRELVRPFLDEVDHLNLAEMDEDVFQSYVLVKERNFKAIKEAEEKEELERLEKIEAEKKEKERIRVENEKLKKERKELEAKNKADEEERAKKTKIEANKRAKEEEERQRILEKERDEQGKILAKEREEKEKVEAELKEKKDIEEKARIEEEKRIEREKKEALKLAKAPVKKKLSVWVSSFEIPLTDLINNKVALDINAKFENFKKWALSEVEKL